MEEEAGGGRREEEGGRGGGGDSAFIQWLTSIIGEINATADTLKDGLVSVQVRKISPNLEILANEERAGNGPARNHVVTGLDDAVAMAVKNLQNLRASLKEECQQQFNLPSSSSSIEPGRGGAAAETERQGTGATCSDDDNMDSSVGGSEGGGSGEVQEIHPPSAPAPACSRHVDVNESITKLQKTDEVVDFDGGFSSRRKEFEFLIRVMSPIPTSREDNKDPRDLLSPESWTLVFDKVEDPQDWLNLYRASSFFQEVLGDQRTTALFPKVLPHIIPYLEKNIINEVLGLRLVCRSWKAVADNLLEESPNPSADSLISSVSVRRHLEQRYSFDSPARISTFLKRFEETHAAGSPLVGSFALLKYDYCGRSGAIPMAKYNLWASRLLEQFGAQLKSLHVEFWHTRFDVVVARLKKCLPLARNLEYLRVRCFNDRLRTGGKEVEVLANGSLLPNLKTVSFIIDGAATRSGMAELQNAVVRLCCSPNSLESVETVGFPPSMHTFINLKSADVILYLPEDCSEPNLPSTPWPLLSKLTLSNYFDGRLGPLFKCVEHFKGTLTELRFKCTLTHDPLVKSKLDLPHLKQLTIEAYPCMTLEFMTSLTNLEILTIHHNPRFRPNMKTKLEEFIQFVQAEVDRWGLRESLPKLTKIILCGSTHPEPNGAYRTLHLVADRRSNMAFKMMEENPPDSLRTSISTVHRRGPSRVDFEIIDLVSSDDESDSKSDDELN